MADFADRMTSLTTHLRNSIQMRNEARKQVHDATVELSNRTQAFMAHVTDEHRTRAEELRESLAAHREECRQKAEELRSRNQESLEKMRDDLNGMLSETRKTRQDTVNQLFHSFQHARNELAQDLREASFAWQLFAAGRDEPVAPMTKPHEPHHHKARATAEAVAEKSPHKEPAAGPKGRSKARRGKG
jgi:dsDNA-specific endonuclease/ATPase MutS2